MQNGVNGPMEGLNGVDIPNYSNEKTRAAEAKLKQFVYDEELAK